MKKLNLLMLAAVLMLAIGCDKNDNPASTQETSVRFTTTDNVKTVPTYFSFDTGAVTDSAGAWDVKLTYTMMVVDTSMPAIKYPFIALNSTRSVTGKVVDGTEFASVNGQSVAGLAADGVGANVIGVNCLNYDGATHRLIPFTNRAFVVQTGTGKRVKFQMLGYYNEAGVSGFMTIEYVKY